MMDHFENDSYRRILYDVKCMQFVVNGPKHVKLLVWPKLLCSIFTTFVYSTVKSRNSLIKYKDDNSKAKLCTGLNEWIQYQLKVCLDKTEVLV